MGWLADKFGCGCGAGPRQGRGGGGGGGGGGGRRRRRRQQPDAAASIYETEEGIPSATPHAESAEFGAWAERQGAKLSLGATVTVAARMRAKALQHYTIPDLVGEDEDPTTGLLNRRALHSLWEVVPAMQRVESWSLIYGLAQHGAMLTTLLTRAHTIAPSLLVVKTTDGRMFGGFATDAWEQKVGAEHGAEFCAPPSLPPLRFCRTPAHGCGSVNVRRQGRHFRVPLPQRELGRRGVPLEQEGLQLPIRRGFRPRVWRRGGGLRAVAERGSVARHEVSTGLLTPSVCAACPVSSSGVSADLFVSEQHAVRDVRLAVPGGRRHRAAAVRHPGRGAVGLRLPGCPKHECRRRDHPNGLALPRARLTKGGRRRRPAFVPPM